VCIDEHQFRSEGSRCRYLSNIDEAWWVQKEGVQHTNGVYMSTSFFALETPTKPPSNLDTLGSEGIDPKIVGAAIGLKNRPLVYFSRR
jgi:hypothetical protein